MPRRKRPNRRLDDLPGLWDLPEAGGTLFTSTETETAATAAPVPAVEEAHASPLGLRHVDQLVYISFGSGSSGNCAYLGLRDKGGVLIDAGVEADKVLKELERNCIPTDGIAGIILTHDHSDHVRFAYPLLRRLRKMRLYCTLRTLQGVLRRHSVSKRIKDYHTPIFKEFPFNAGELEITPFEVSHDGTDNVGFSIDALGHRFVVATDMGEVTPRADFYIRQANFLMIETNYDDDMLTAGSYPEYLKARIRSAIGHMDNARTAEYLAEIWTPALTDIYLCHLSNDNNRPATALRAVTEALQAKGVKIGDAEGDAYGSDADLRVSALPRFESSPLHVHRLDRR